MKEKFNKVPEGETFGYSTQFATRYNPHPPHKYATVNEEPSMTQQQFKAECNVNNILAKYRKTGMLTHINKHQGQFGDFENVEDYQTALNKVMEAQDSFSLLPSELRTKFHNDPGKLIEWLSDKANDEEAVKYGLKKTPEEKINFQDSMEKALEANDKRRKSTKE